MIIGTRNWLPDLASLAISTPTTASGYAQANLWQGGTAQAWRSSSPSSTHTFEFRLTADRPVDLAAVFDVRATGTATVQSVALGRKSVWGFGTVTSEGSITLNARGDGARKLAMPVTAETWVITVTLSGSANLTVGGLWLGQAQAISRGYATRRDTLQYHTIQNVSDAQSVRTAELADYTARFSLGFDRLRDSERDEVVAALHAVRGGRYGCVLVPKDDEPSAAYYGRLQTALTWGVDFPVNDGLSLDFVEDGRALG